MSKDKQARRASDAQKIALEKQLVKEGKIFPRTRYVPRSFAGRVLAVVLAFLIGVVAAIGGLLGVGYFAGTRPLKDVFGMLNIDYTQWLTDSAAELNALQLVQQISGGGIDSMGDIAAYTPYVDTLITTLNEQLSAIGVSIDSDELKATSFSDLGSYFSDVVRNTELGKALGVTAESDPILVAICYGSEGTNEEGGDYTLNDSGEIVMNEGKSPTTIASLTEGGNIVGNITIESALSVNADSNSAMRYLAYGTEGVSYTIETDSTGNKYINMLRDPMTGTLYRKKKLSDLTGTDNVMGDAVISDIINIDESTSGLLYAIRDWTVNDLGNQARLERLKISQVVTIDENASNILKAMSAWRISDLSDQKKIDSLTLGDVISVGDDSPSILKALRDTRLGELAQATQELRLVDLLGTEAVQQNRLLKNLALSSVSTLAADMDNLTVGQVYGDQIYSYLDLGADGTGKTYADYLSGYDPDDPDGQTNENRPDPIRCDADSFKLTQTRLLLDGEGQETHTQVLQGWFRTADGKYVPVDEDDVRRTADGAFSRIEIFLTPDSYVWNAVNYDNGGALTPLPAGTIGTDTTGYTVEQNGTDGTPVTDGGAPLYYLTERTVPSAEGDTMQKIAYPVMEDANGQFVRVRELEDGAEYSSVRRIDLERTIAEYVYTQGGSPVALDENGNVLYGEGDAQQALEIRTRVSGDETLYYILSEETVEQLYYYEDAGNYVSVTEDDFSVVYTASWTEQDGAVTIEDHRVDRFLDGIWYVLLGRDEDGNPVDNSATPILEIAPTISDATDLINSLPLWELWLHGVINENPFAVISYTENQTDYSNLNQLNVGSVIRYIKALSQRP
ncbi:MAG TPA: hypothetical protein H9676_07100 [Firmicutes bacterium]|nr:hypothetical protein [Bacillota bacterium]